MIHWTPSRSKLVPSNISRAINTIVLFIDFLRSKIGVTYYFYGLSYFLPLVCSFILNEQIFNPCGKVLSMTGSCEKTLILLLLLLSLIRTTAVIQSVECLSDMREFAI